MELQNSGNSIKDPSKATKITAKASQLCAKMPTKRAKKPAGRFHGAAKTTTSSRVSRLKCESEGKESRIFHN